jgi:hypothetical protein
MKECKTGQMAERGLDIVTKHPWSLDRAEKRTNVQLAAGKEPIS